MTLGFTEDDDLGKLNPFTYNRANALFVNFSKQCSTSMFPRHNCFIHHSYVFLFKIKACIYLRFQSQALRFMGMKMFLKLPKFLKSVILKWAYLNMLINVNIKCCMQQKPKKLFLTLSYKDTFGNLFLPLHLFFYCSFDLISFAHYFQGFLWYMTHISAFIHFYEASLFNSHYSHRYRWRYSDLSCPANICFFVVVCFILFLFLFIYLFIHFGVELQDGEWILFNGTIMLLTLEIYIEVDWY